MQKNFKLIIEYDGSNFLGWQRQEGSRTVQGVIESAIVTMIRCPVTLIGSGRTDSGVHAFGQVANFLCETRLTAAVFQRGLNGLLPDDVVIHACSQIEEQFHARYSAKSKVYQYRILNQDIPPAVGRQYAWYIRKQLDLKAMQEASSHILGCHDFKSFEGVGSSRSSSVRKVLQACWQEPKPGHFLFEVEANGFLRFMVRNLVGTLVEVGRGKILPHDFNSILLSRDRNKAGPTAPAQGLFLMQVKY